MAYVYKHIRLDTGEVFYVGIGKDDSGLHKRAHSKKYRSDFWRNVISKTDYKVEILDDNIGWNAAGDLEKHYISIYGRRDLGQGTLVNLTDGGDGQKRMSMHTSEKISNSAARKPVLQYSIKSEFIKEWPSITEAAINSGVKDRSSISKCCNNKGSVKSVGGYIWRYKDPKLWFDPAYINLSKDPEVVKKRTLNTDFSKKRKPVIQYNRNGEVIKEWDSCTQASNHTGISISCINDCCNGKQKGAGGHQWTFKSVNPDKKSIGELLYPDKNKNRKIPVVQYTQDGTLIREWESAKDVEKFIGYKAPLITKCCKGKSKASYGFVWRYKNL